MIIKIDYRESDLHMLCVTMNKYTTPIKIVSENIPLGDIIEKVKPENYKNYFEHAYKLKEGIKLHKKPSTRRRKLKNYK